MSKNLETADTIVKLVLAVAVIIFYFADIITGPFAQALMIIAFAVVIIFSVKIFTVKNP